MNPRKPRKPFAKRSLGQNFLVDHNYISKIIAALDPSESDTVVEIGPGRGALTERLLERAGRLIALELDRDLIPHLEEKFQHRQNFHLIEQDALSVDFDDLLAGGATANSGVWTVQTSKTKLAANLPYYISTAILQRLIEQRTVFSEMVLMFQREVVDRIRARPGDSERGFLTVLVEAFMDVEKLFDVPPSAFRPAPKVWSSVVRMRLKETRIGNEAIFRRIVSTAFAQKRKTILNNLKAHFPHAADLLLSAGIEPTRRAETLTETEWATLTSMIEGRSIKARDTL